MATWSKNEEDEEVEAECIEVSVDAQPGSAAEFAEDDPLKVLQLVAPGAFPSVCIDAGAQSQEEDVRGQLCAPG